MRYQCALLAVRDVQKSLQFYQSWFGMEVEMDLGWNVALKGGLALQQNFAWLTGLPEESVNTWSHDMELYFETDDLDSVNARLMADEAIQWVHPIKEHDWKQRVVRIYDPDHHIIEIGEAMQVVFKRLLAQGLTAPEIAGVTQFPLETVLASLDVPEGTASACIRIAEMRDAAAIHTISLRALGYTNDLETVTKQLSRILQRPSERIWVLCTDGGAVQGYLHAADYETLYSGSMKHIVALAVLPEAQGSGFGRLLLQQAERWAQQCGCHAVTLESGTTRVQAHAFYEHCGYHLRKEHKNFIKEMPSVNG